MFILLTYPELVSIASVGQAAASLNDRETPILNYVRIVSLTPERVTAMATDRYLVGRVSFDAKHAGGNSTGEVLVHADTLKRAATVAKSAGVLGGANLTVGSLGTVELTIDATGERLVSPAPPAGVRYPAIERLFPKTTDHENDIAAGEGFDLTRLARFAKLRHPDDVLTGTKRTNFGAFKISRAHSLAERGAGIGPWLLTRRDGDVNGIAMPIKNMISVS